MKTGSGTVHVPGQVVLVLQGGGALGAYQVGVYQALHEAGIEPDWVIGTSIGAINAALIAGNPVGDRFGRLREFWKRVEHDAAGANPLAALTGLPNVATNLATVVKGIPCFFTPYPPAWWGTHVPLEAEAAAYYSTAPLRSTLADLLDGGRVATPRTRLTIGAVSARSGEMRYFDSRDETLGLDHVIASGALPPMFPAVRIGGEPYWDGGIYSNTPIEAVFNDRPRRDSVIFAVQMWNAAGPEPQTMWDVIGRQKEIQYASRNRSHVARQQQIHHLRRVIRALEQKIPRRLRDTREVRDLAAWGCGTTMHIVRLAAPRLEGEDYLKDIDFTPAGIRARWRAGHRHARRALAAAPWRSAADPIEGVVVHDGPWT
jgi:NTE family protein